MTTIIGACPCGEAKVELPERIEYDTLLYCEAGHAIKLDLRSVPGHKRHWDTYLALVDGMAEVEVAVKKALKGMG